jgi:hypothetical protein
MMLLRKKKKEKRERRREQQKELQLILLKILQPKTMNSHQLMEKDNLQKVIMKVVSLILRPKRFIVNM